MDRCSECEFVYDDVPRDRIALEVRRRGREHGNKLLDLVRAGHDEALRAHPIEGMWSALEYACHVRDMLDVQRSRVELAQIEVNPDFVPMGRDERAVTDRYNEQDPIVVGHQVTDAAAALGDVLAGLDDEGWGRSGVYHWPETATRDMTWVGRHTVHELAHHALDVDRVLWAAGESTPGDQRA